MPITSVDAIRITVEETNGIKPKKTDTKEQAEFRKSVAAEIAQIKEAGLIVEIPFEFPELDVE